MGTQRESICIVVTLHESIRVGLFICNELPGKKTFSYVCAKGVSCIHVHVHSGEDSALVIVDRPLCYKRTKKQERKIIQIVRSRRLVVD